MNTTTDWVTCPICGDCDMKRVTDGDGNVIISCVNHECASNGGSNADGLATTRAARPIDTLKARNLANALTAELQRLEHAADDNLNEVDNEETMGTAEGRARYRTLRERHNRLCTARDEVQDCLDSLSAVASPS